VGEGRSKEARVCAPSGVSSGGCCAVNMGGGGGRVGGVDTGGGVAMRRASGSAASLRAEGTGAWEAEGPRPRGDDGDASEGVTSEVVLIGCWAGGREGVARGDTAAARVRTSVGSCCLEGMA